MIHHNTQMNSKKEQQDKFDLLENYISSRASRRSLQLSVARLRYANKWLFRGVPIGGSALFIGVGSGHDALLALLEGHCTTVVGVDPYIETDGNGETEFQELVRLTSLLGLDNKIEIHREESQTYLSKFSARKFDLVVCVDVLHHIFVTKEKLSNSTEGMHSTEFFLSLRGTCRSNGSLLISETSRHGLRPFLVDAGILSGSVDYSTKQSNAEWSAAATAAGWRLIAIEDYVPWKLKRWSSLLANPVGRYTLCDRYKLLFNNGG